MTVEPSRHAPRVIRLQIQIDFNHPMVYDAEGRVGINRLRHHALEYARADGGSATRAARLMDLLRAEGLVGAAEATGSREALAASEPTITVVGWPSRVLAAGIESADGNHRGFC